MERIISIYIIIIYFRALFFSAISNPEQTCSDLKGLFSLDFENTGGVNLAAIKALIFRKYKPRQKDNPNKRDIKHRAIVLMIPPTFLIYYIS